MATDTQFGSVHKFEDFLVTAIADLPEIDTQAVTGDTVAVVAAGADGRLRHSISTSNDDDVGATTFGALNWVAGVTDMYMEARLFLSSITDNKFFVGFGDSIATADETTFSLTTDTVTIDTQTDAIGIAFDNDATTKNLWAVAGAADAVTVGHVLSATYNPKAATAITLGVWLSADCKSARWYVNGKEVYAVDGASSVLVASGATLVPGVWNYEQASAYTADLDYLYARKGRATT